MGSKEKKSKKSKKSHKKSSKKSKKHKKISKYDSSSSSSSSDEWCTAQPADNIPKNVNTGAIFSHIDQSTNNDPKTSSSQDPLSDIFSNIGQAHQRKDQQKIKEKTTQMERDEKMLEKMQINNRMKFTVEEKSKTKDVRQIRPTYSLDFLKSSFFRMKKEAKEGNIGVLGHIIILTYYFLKFVFLFQFLI